MVIHIRTGSMGVIEEKIIYNCFKKAELFILEDNVDSEDEEDATCADLEREIELN